MALKKAFKKKWIEALRSGKYRQGTRALRSDRGFCCLGVACDIIDPKGWINRGNYDQQWLTKGVDADDARTAYIPSLVMKKIGLTCAAEAALTRLNDFGGFTFSQIADYIEKEL